jgi:hypothetical protein
MSTTQSKRRSAKRVATKADVPVAPTTPPVIPATEEELAHEKAQIERLEETIRLLHQRNLDNAVLLAQQAAAGRGPLVEHFQELGRRFGHTLNAPPPRPTLRVISGGAA